MHNEAEVSAGKVKQCHCKGTPRLPTGRLLCGAAARVSLTGSLYKRSNKQVVIHQRQPGPSIKTTSMSNLSENVNLHACFGNHLVWLDPIKTPSFIVDVLKVAQS